MAPVPAVSVDEVDAEAAEKPVSYNEPPTAQQPVVNQSKPARHQEPRLPKGAHPVVKAPEPLLPQTSTQPKPEGRPMPKQKSERRQRVKVTTEKPAKPNHSRTRQPKIAKAKSQQGNVTMTVPVEAASAGQADPPTESVASGHPAKPHHAKKGRPAPVASQPKQVAAHQDSRGKNKPLVHFPETLTAGAEPAGHRSAMAGETQNRHIYPVGYRPFIMPVGPEKHRALEKAISHYNRANFYGQRNEPDNAILEYQKALSLNPAFADAYVGLSTASMRKNDWENVIEMARNALKLKADFMEPTNITQARFNLSTAYCVTDNPHSAKRYYKKVKQAGHPDTERLWAYIQKNCKR